MRYDRMGSDAERNGPSRRRALKLAGGTLATTVGFAGCSEDGGTPTEGGGDDDDNGGGGMTDTDPPEAELVFWHTEPEDKRKRRINDITQRFNDQNDKNITVKAQPVDETQINEQVLAGAAAGTLPNVILPNVQMIQQLGAEGLLAKEAVGEAIDRIGRDRFLNGPLNMLQAGSGGHFGTPHSTFINTFWYRKSVFEEQGLPEPNTWDGLKTAAEALHDPDNDQFGIGTANKKDVYMRQCITPFIFSNGGRVLNEQGDVVFDSPEVAEALEAYADITQFNPPGKHSFGTTRDVYLNGNLHNTMWSTYILDDILNSGGQELVDDTEIVSAIEHDQEGMIGLVQGATILNSDNRDISEREVQASIDFLEYLYSDQAYIDFIHLAPGGMRPVLGDISSKDAYQDNEVLNAWGDTQDKINQAINSDGFGQFGIVNGKVFPEFGKAAGQLLVAEAGLRVVDGEDAQTVVDEQAEKIRNAMQS